MAVAAPGADPTPLVPRVAAIGRSERRSGLPVGLVGLVLVVGGAVLQVISYAGAAWLDSTGNPDIPAGQGVRLGFGDFSDRTQRGFAHIYFVWGAWLLFALMLSIGVAGCIRWRWARVFRVAGTLLGVIGAVAVVAGVLVFVYQTKDDLFHVARNYAVGPYLAVLGLLASAFGAAAGEVGT